MSFGISYDFLTVCGAVSGLLVILLSAFFDLANASDSTATPVILLSIKSPIAFKIFWITLLDVVLNTSVTD